MGMITLKEYTARHNGSIRYLRQKAQNGGFITAQKIGRDWFIDEDEPCQDNRITSGKWVGYQRARNRDKGGIGEKLYHVHYSTVNGGPTETIDIYAKTKDNALRLAIDDAIIKKEGSRPAKAYVHSVTCKNGNIRILKS